MPLDQQRVLSALTRLNEPHTRAGAWEELSRLVPTLDGHSGATFLSCLHSTNAQFTLPCRTGAVRLFGVVAERQPLLLRPAASKVVESIVARARDKDGGRELRDACAEALGLVLANESSALPAVLRGVLPLLAEPNEHTQLAGLACVSGLLQKAADMIGDSAAAKLAVALLRLLGHCCVGAHAAALETSAILLEKCAASAAAHAPSFVNPCIRGTESREWTTRRAASVLLKTLATTQQPAALAQARRLVPAIQALRHDKHKAVREAAAQAAGALRGMGADSSGGGVGANLPPGRATSLQLRERIRMDREAARQRAAVSEAGGAVDDSDKFSVVSSEGVYSIASAPPRMVGRPTALALANGDAHSASSSQQFSRHRSAMAAAASPAMVAAQHTHTDTQHDDHCGGGREVAGMSHGAGGVAAARQLRLGAPNRLDTIMSMADEEMDSEDMDGRSSRSIGATPSEAGVSAAAPLRARTPFAPQSTCKNSKESHRGEQADDEILEEEFSPDDCDLELKDGAPDPSSAGASHTNVLDGSGGLSQAELRRSLRWVRSQLDRQLDASMVAWASDDEAESASRANLRRRSAGSVTVTSGSESEMTVEGEDEDAFERQIERLERGEAPPPPLRTFAANSARRRDSEAAAEAAGPPGAEQQGPIHPPRAWPLGGRMRSAKPAVLVAAATAAAAQPEAMLDESCCSGPTASDSVQLRAELAQALRDGIAAEARARAAEMRLAQLLADHEAQTEAATDREASLRQELESVSRRAQEAEQGREAALAAADGALETAATAARAAEEAASARDAAISRAQAAETAMASGKHDPYRSDDGELTTALLRAHAAENALESTEAAIAEAAGAAEMDRAEIARLIAAVAEADERRREAEVEAARALRQAEAAVAAAARVSEASEAQRLASQGREDLEARANTAEAELAAMRTQYAVEAATAAQAAAAREEAIKNEIKRAEQRAAAAEAVKVDLQMALESAREQISALEAAQATAVAQLEARIASEREAAEAAKRRADNAEAEVAKATEAAAEAHMKLVESTDAAAVAEARIAAAEAAREEAAAAAEASQRLAREAEARAVAGAEARVAAAEAAMKEATLAVAASSTKAAEAELRAARVAESGSCAEERATAAEEKLREVTALADAANSAREAAEAKARSESERILQLQEVLNQLSEEKAEAIEAARRTAAAIAIERAAERDEAEKALAAAADAVTTAEKQHMEVDALRAEALQQLSRAEARLAEAEVEAQRMAGVVSDLQAAREAADAAAQEAAASEASKLKEMEEHLATVEAQLRQEEAGRREVEARAEEAEQQLAGLTSQLGMARGVASMEREKRRAIEEEFALFQAQVAHDAERRAQSEAERIATAAAASRPGAGKGVNRPKVEKAPIPQTQFQLQGLGKAPPLAAARRATSAQPGPRR